MGQGAILSRLASLRKWQLSKYLEDMRGIHAVFGGRGNSHAKVQEQKNVSLMRETVRRWGTVRKEVVVDETGDRNRQCGAQ